ncbi:MAG: hypothetical protein J7502_11935 [Flavisolibacter sp.]|nr:hypothetical protein [Flavisolibacter sp.]
MLDFETTKKIIEGKMDNVQVLGSLQGYSLKKSFMASDTKNDLNSSPSIEELRKKFLDENNGDSSSGSTDAKQETDDIGVIKVRNKDQGADSPHTSGDRTIIVKKGGIYGAQG